LTIIQTSCSSYISVIQPSRSDNIILRNSEEIGQSFVAKYDGLDQISFFIKNENIASGVVKFSLKDAQSGAILFSADYPVEGIPSKGYFPFSFPEIKKSNQIMYIVSLRYEGNDQLRFCSTDGSQYINGSAYKNGIPIDAQLAFQLGHKKSTLLAGLVQEFTGWMVFLFVGLLFFSLPGWGVLNWCLPGWQRYDWLEKLWFSCCFTLALIPIVFLWAKIFKLPLSIWLAIVLALLGLGLIVLKNWKTIERLKHLHFELNYKKADFLFYFILIFIIFGLIFTRFWVVRNLDLPLWGDSYHHSLIVQLLDDHHGLFDDWLPYADLYDLSYHYGFHASTVVFKWIVGWQSPQAVQFMGQFINILAVIALYPLAKKVGKNRWAGVATIFIAGILLWMPNSYTNWGRYTQLSAQVLLPASILIIWDLFEKLPLGELSSVEKEKILRILLVGWVLWCGLALIHVRVAVFAAVSIPVLFLLGINKNNVLRRFWVLLFLALGSLILYIPWLPNVMEGQVLNLMMHYFRTPVNSTVGLSIQDSDKIQDITAFLPIWAWIGMFISLSVGFWKRNHTVLLIGGWWLLVTLAANPGWLGIPGNGAITNFALLIAFYIPAAILIGGAIGWVFDEIKGLSKPKSIISLVCVVIITLLMVFNGIKDRVNDIDIPKNALSVRPDIIAAEWIRNNIPEGSRFYVNSFFAYGDTLVVGSDGGWWLPLLANRSTTLPPITYGIEPGPVEDYITYVNSLVRVVQMKGITDPDTINLFREYGVTHVYIGQQQGSVNAPDGTQIDVDDLLRSPYYSPVYHVDRVWIFELLPN
jgi:hypothetical protein